MITITDKGAEKVREFLDSQGDATEGAGLRVGVRGGGCSGFQYALAFDEQRDDDEVFDVSGLKILVDKP
ncbi:MAG: iron-sulfur cluster assembly accessory protein, partial [Solirubrobacteraceae bacterium]|nr:iron-sulfur cluster assembly accessory protein [Solirubrobacteraceae bacterium]